MFQSVSIPFVSSVIELFNKLRAQAIKHFDYQCNQAIQQLAWITQNQTQLHYRRPSLFAFFVIAVLTICGHQIQRITRRKNYYFQYKLGLKQRFWYSLFEIYNERNPREQRGKSVVVSQINKKAVIILIYNTFNFLGVQPALVDCCPFICCFKYVRLPFTGFSGTYPQI